MTLLSTGLVGHWLIASLEDRYPYQPIDAIAPVETIVVLGGMVHAFGARGPEPEFEGRVDRILMAEALFRAGKGRQILISGGSGFLGDQAEPEATQLRRWLIKRGLPAGKIIAETTSRNTAENAQRTAAILRRRKGFDGRILVVTSAFHMHRSILCFRKVGLKPIPVPTDYISFLQLPFPEIIPPSNHGLRMSVTALKEYVGLLAYRMRGYL